MTLSLNTTASSYPAEIIEQDRDRVAISALPKLCLVQSPNAQPVQAQKRAPFRLRAYLPSAYLSTPRGRRAGSYA